ncbi:hypothetical protein J3Q64DRAFT_1669601 [Phycomyces blakesleeanus]|uniref:GATA-type domain-containing protein n=1 Tax=Phycomyces blakesleeanus TaxID=4837 RepID=A0ABR3BD36_PHYBL
MNGSFRCHIGTGKASRPIRSTELCRQMRLLAVFFRAENSKSQLVSPDFIFFPTWLLHLFRYTQHGSTPGRTDVRFLENAGLAKEDHIYRLNHVLNTLFRFNLHNFDGQKMQRAVELANYLFDTAGLDPSSLPRPYFPGEDLGKREQPGLYPTLVLLLHTPRPSKTKPFCHNCNTKPASRRKLCVACYRYQLKHGEARPLRLIVANRPGPRLIDTLATADHGMPLMCPSNVPRTMIAPIPRSQKSCANCGVHETHQWYRNLCGAGHWCETCKSYYLRHTKVRPPELFVKAAKRKVDVRTLVNWSSWAAEDDTDDTAAITTKSRLSTPITRRSSDSTVSTVGSWTPSGCRPHLYHARYSCSASSVYESSSSSHNSPDASLVSSPTTPPSVSPSFFSHSKHRTSISSTQSSTLAPQTYGSPYGVFYQPWSLDG